MIFLIIVSIALTVCLVVVVINCLNCLKRQKKQTFRPTQPERAHNNPSFTVEITDSQDNEHVAIEPLPDILSITTAAPIRPKIICSERGKQDAALSLVSVQRSFPREQIQYLNEVESGWFGKVLDSEACKIISGCDKSRVMVKMLKDDAHKSEQKQFLDEVLAFRCLEHANLLGLLGQCVETTPFLILLEFAPHGNLKTFLVEHRLEAEAMIKRHRLQGFAVDVAAGLACLHRHGYIHNDLAARNCLIMSDYTVKIGDYGISDVLFKEDYMVSGSHLLPVRWMAPETVVQSKGVWTSQPGNKVSDMWAFGVLLWEVFSFGDRPYNMLTDQAVLQGVVVDKLLKPEELDTRLNDRDTLWQLMGQCWQEPAQRVEIEYVYQQLDHMISARRDTVEVSVDFEQRWSELPPNKRASSIDTDLGSRIALAGSFAGSTTTEKSSDTSINIEAVSDLTPSLEIMENSPVPSTHDFHGSGDQKDGLTGAAEIKNNTSGLAGSGDAEKSFTSMVIADIVVESVNQEAVITPVKPVAVTSSTPADSKPSETSEYFSPLTSTPASLYETAIETSKTPESGSKDSVLMGIDSTVQYIDISEDAELTSIKQEINEGEESLHLSGDFNDFVRASPTVKSLDFGDFESSQLDTDVEVSNNKGVPSGISSDFSEFEGASENFSTLGAIDKTADQNQPTETTKHLSEKSNTPQTSQSLSLQFESLNLESLAQINLKDPISDFASETEPQGPQPHDIVVPESFQMSESVPAEQVEASTPGPLLDEDVDKLVQSSHEPEQASLGNISVASLPSEPAQFVIPETTAVLAAQAMAFTGVPEQQHSLDQNLISLPAHVPATEALEASQDSLMAALGESLESHPKSQEQEGSLQEEKVTEDPSGSEKKSEATTSSMAEWDLLGLETGATPLDHSTNSGKESSSSSRPNQDLLRLEAGTTPPDPSTDSAEEKSSPSEPNQDLLGLEAGTTPDPSTDSAEEKSSSSEPNQDLLGLEAGTTPPSRSTDSAKESSSSSEPNQDLLGLEAGTTPPDPSTDSAKESSSSSVSNQATLIDLL